MGRDFKNDLCNTYIRYFKDHIEDEGKYTTVLFLKKFPNDKLQDSFISELAALPIHSVISIDIVPISPDITAKTLQKKYIGIESDIIRQQQVRNRNNDFASGISYAKRSEKAELEDIMDSVRNDDQNMFYVGVTIIVTAETKEELNSIVKRMMAFAKEKNCKIEPHFYKQREAFNTAIPIGVRQVETLRSLLSKSVTALLPFNIQEMNDSGGIYYGVNKISKNIIICNRKKYLNANGFILGSSGSGKSMEAKIEMTQVLLGSDDYVITIDPMGEYADIARNIGGQVVNLSSDTNNYVNPLDVDLKGVNERNLKSVIAEKSEFMLGVLDQLSEDGINQRHRSIVDRCVRILYQTAYRAKKVPLMSDFYGVLKGQKEEEARELALVLEAFVEGSLNIFNHRTNVDMSNRFIVYGIQDLGAQLAPVAMMVMMESIQAKIIENGRNGRATWLYIDEIHVLLNSDYCTRYLQQLWKKVRKQGGICTGISQNISDLLENDIVATLISNSEFMALLKQSGVDSPEIAKVLEVSKTELEYVKDANVGRGLIKCGKTIVPFDNTINEDSGLYQMFSTNFYERVEKGLIDDGASALMDEDVYGETTRLDETTVLKRSRRKGG